MGDLIEWKNIVSLGAGGAAVPHLGDPKREFAATRSGTVICPVIHFDLLHIHGPDAKAFLQGQLTCDLDQITPDHARFGGYCSPKGRLLANFLLWSTPQGYLMQLPADVSSGIADRLRKFVLRSRVEIEHGCGLGLLGLAGPGAPGLLHRAFSAPPAGRLDVVQQEYASVIRLPGDCFLVIAAANAMAGHWEVLTREALPVGAECWNWLQIQAGVAWITAATQDQFLPQMTGLDAIGGVSFDKGCYTGQEIVARARYLGEVKRTLRRGSTRGGVRPGDALSSGGRQCGTILNAACVPGYGTELLAVVSEQVDAQTEVQIASGDAVVLSVPSGASVPG
jgi:folate-binding protein YgfZ